MTRPSLFALALMASLFSGPGAAHVSLESQTAPAGASYKASFKLGHGCGAAPTRQVSVSIPAGVRGTRPMPKPGWTLELQRSGDEVTRVTWTARTPADMLASEHYDEYVLVARLPQRTGPLYWPVSQVCEPGRVDWAEVPRAGQNPSELKSPAPLLEIRPAAGGAGHKH